MNPTTRCGQLPTFTAIISEIGHAIASLMMFTINALIKIKENCLFFGSHVAAIAHIALM